jgi:hypothetical protein
LKYWRTVSDDVPAGLDMLLAMRPPYVDK